MLVLSNISKTISESRTTIYQEIDRIKFEGSFYRKDIALRAEEK